jgi:hypothetical protein
MIRSTRDGSSVTRLLANVYPFCEKMTQNSHQPKKFQNANISKSYFLHQKVLKSQQGWTMIRRERDQSSLTRCLAKNLPIFGKK